MFIFFALSWRINGTAMGHHGTDIGIHVTYRCHNGTWQRHDTRHLACCGKAMAMPPHRPQLTPWHYHDMVYSRENRAALPLRCLHNSHVHCNYIGGCAVARPWQLPRPWNVPWQYHWNLPRQRHPNVQTTSWQPILWNPMTMASIPRWHPMITPWTVYESPPSLLWCLEGADMVRMPWPCHDTLYGRHVRSWKYAKVHMLLQ